MLAGTVALRTRSGGSMINTGTDQHVEICFARAALLGDLLGEFAGSKGAPSCHVERIRDIGTRAFPILLWKMDAAELTRDVRTAKMFSLLTRFGISNSVLMRSDTPQAIRQALFPVLRPNRYASVAPVVGRHSCAPPRGDPSFESLEIAGTFDGLTMLPAEMAAFSG